MSEPIPGREAEIGSTDHDKGGIQGKGPGVGEDMMRWVEVEIVGHTDLPQTDD
jgi:hypothetical protein